MVEDTIWRTMLNKVIFYSLQKVFLQLCKIMVEPLTWIVFLMSLQGF